ncbi:calcium-binding protein [Hydromonas duriensis]|uniref:Hemolysin type calcium-binding protein n=1 Tax=Hydromonas duriensis TaxID=1527608 RepID=A0A4R6Y662_9BURK|nr:calcium-binding protein [Hydromonas duriensis]TDR31064.1 hemolysin type calcium-binding protein [Hydromonas duriensis]
MAVISGTDGNDTLIGTASADTMSGLAGDDTYIVDNVGDVVIEQANQGIDLVRASVNYTLTSNVEHLTLTGSAALSGKGNDLNNLIIANNAGNSLFGGAGNDTLQGGNGNDVLDGGTGADKMSGGAGNDTYIVDNAGDVVIELAGGGTDLVKSSVNYTLTANVENLTLTGTQSLVGRGNDSANNMTANAAGDSLYGGGGSDKLTGGDGNDYLDGGVCSDTLFGGAGDDKLVWGADTWWGTGGTSTNLWTGQVIDVQYKSRSIDFFDGGTGVDTLLGSGCPDLIVLDDLTDFGTVWTNQPRLLNIEVIDSGLGDDVINLTSKRFSLSNLTILAGDGADTVWSSTGNDTIFGGAGNDVLDGAAGNDVLDGGVGNDTLIGGAGKDVFTFSTALNATSNKDVISGFAVADDKVALDDAVFTALTGQTSLLAGQFAAGAGLSAGRDADDRIVYNTTTGVLFYDADGSGAGAAVAFAQLSPNLALNNTHFQVI